MSKFDNPLLLETESHIRSIYLNAKEPLLFHNLEHTQNVVRYCNIIASHYNLSAEEKLPIQIAAWFHDAGYAIGTPRHHEEQSSEMASAFLTEKNVSPDLIEKVRGCIMATKMPQSPSNLQEQIICDADLFHLGSPNYEDHNKLLRQEINSLQNEKVSKKDWRKINIEFLERHRYFTDYCRERLEPIKQKHLENLLNRQSKKEKAEAVERLDEPDIIAVPVDPVSVAITEVDEEPKVDEAETEVEEEKKDKKKDKPVDEKAKQNKTERGVVAMFRIMSENHINLSQMADSKANIMISVNTIVISIMVSVLLGKLQFYPEYIIPAIILVSICLGAVVFAILATRPNVSSGTFTKEDIQEKRINLLFFGNFYNMKIDDYDWAMKEMMNDRDYLYGSMIKDMYYLGVVLARKYKFLRISYNIFMFGLIAAILSFVIAFMLSGTATNQ